MPETTSNTDHITTRALETLIGPEALQALHDNGLVVVQRRNFYDLLRRTGTPVGRFKTHLRLNLAMLACKLFGPGSAHAALFRAGAL